MSLAVIVLVLGASRLLAQTSGPAGQKEERTFFSTTYVFDARIESAATVSSASPAFALASDACAADATTLCLNNGRFQVRVIFSAPSLGITNAPAQAIPLTSDTGYMWFFSSNNVELVIKVVDGRAFNNFFWVFYGALSDVTYTITITDMGTGAVKVYSNPQGRLASVADTAAFPSGLSCSYTVSPASPASFGSSGGSGTVSVTTQSGCAWTATSGSSFITITGGSSGSGNGTVSFSVASNGGASSRTGTMTIAGQTVTITESGVSSGGTYDGSWSGTTSQTCGTSPCAVSWTVANTAITGFSVGYDAHACGAIRGGTSITYDTPRPITGGNFTVTDTGGFRINFSVGGTGPVDGHWTVNGTFNSSSSSSGSGSVTLPVCSSTVPITFSATKM